MKIQYIIVYCFLFLFADVAQAQHAVEFVENKGQWGTWFRYKADMQGGTEVCMENDGFRYILSDPDNTYKQDYFQHGQTKENPILKFHVYKVSFVGANLPEITGERPQKVYYNYFLGNDPSAWKSEIHPFLALNYNKLYNGIDMHVFSEKDNLEYEFIVAPNADAGQVKMKFEGQDNLKIKDQKLLIGTSVGTVTEMKPYVYQYVNNERVEVACEYRLKNNILTFDFPEGYDHTQQLIIDPVVVLCTMTGSTADNWGYSATYDDAGNFYAGGLVNDFATPGTSFPVSPGAFQVKFGGGYGTAGPSTGYAYAADISIIKYDPTLKNRIYATYLGGAGNDHVHSMIVDPAGNLVIAGRTISVNYPVTSGCYQSTNKGWWDIVVTKFNSTGTALIGSTYIGGSGSDGVNFDSTEYGYGELKYNYGDDSRSEVQLDNTGSIFVTSCTNSADFPQVSSTAPGITGLQEGVVCKFNSTLSSLVWSTYFGGSGSDAGYVLAFDNLQQNVYVAGGTNSPNFPTTPGTLHTTFQGGRADGFILKYKNGAPYNLQAGTFIGTSDYDQVFGIQVSSTTDEVYVMGQTIGGTFPVTPGVYSDAGSSQFVMNLDKTLATNLASTVFGSKSSSFTNISPVAFLVDTCDNVYISGWGGSLGIAGVASGQCTGMATTTDGYLRTTDGQDFYFIVLGPKLASLKYASYYGRNCTGSPDWMQEHVDGGTSRFDRHGIIYQGVCANCGGTIAGCPTPFPTTKGVWSETDASGNCNEAALKIAFNIGPVDADVSAGPATSGCAPLTVSFTNTSTNGLTYVWDFGDGGTSSTFSPTHTFVGAGTFTVTLSAANSNACFKTNDTAYIIIRVDTNIIKPDFTYALKDSCNPYIASFTNTSIDHVGTPNYIWYFGDGSNYAGDTPPNHNYADTGNYNVMLVMFDPLACKSPDTVKKVLRMHNIHVSGSFKSADTLCLGSLFVPVVTTQNEGGILWNFGNGATSTVKVPNYKFPKIGVYTIRFQVTNGGACNGVDSGSQQITVVDGPEADFDYTPIPPVANEPVTFANHSLRALTYAWEFGDNTTGTETNPIHQYNRTGTYKACLSAFNLSNCPSKICKDVATEVHPIIGVPTAFSPNGDGDNDILYVRGAAIKTMDLKIYNRWGQLIFESTSKDKGWDGKFNGQPQPIEAYAFILNAGFIDGTSKLMKGNITLLR
ncbi:MAG: domain containing protein [Flavipsychrobacter sp.]|nr:domain containing protein [Flavipsychrobacter sp.]